MTEAHKRVLIVDDEESIAVVLAAGLSRSKKYVVEIATSGQDALAKFKINPFDLVLTDYRMPDMSGIELSQRIRQINPDTLIMLMTAYDSSQVRQQAGKLNLQEYIQKPIPVAQIRAIVEQALAQTLAESEKPLPNKRVDDDVEELVRKLRLDTQANCALLLRSAGHLVMVDGVTSELDITSISALIAANFIAATELARLLGNQSVFRSSFHEGPDYDIYAHDVNGDFLLAVIFGNNSKAGLVRHYTQETTIALRPPLDKLTEMPADYADDFPETLDREFDELFGFTDSNGGGGGGQPDSSDLFGLEKARSMGLIPETFKS